LALAQYRELAAFAQLSTDLDKATKDQLTRGERMVEILKQDIFQPLPFERQVMIIFAGNEGLLDDVALPRLKDFEKGLLAFLDKNYADIEHEIREKKAISDEAKKKLTQAITKFKQEFK
jgi:F-type H+-transporting ATPase subunit alpha